MLKPQQTQRIYAMGARLGLVESGNKNDLLHELVFSISQKNSVRELDEKEYKRLFLSLLYSSKQLILQSRRRCIRSRLKSVRKRVSAKCQTVR